MKVCFDVNVVIDVWGVSEDVRDSFAALDVALTKGFDVCIPAASTACMEYVLSARKYLSPRKANEALGDIMEVFELLDLTSADCRFAYESDMGDYEDALIAYAAKRNDVDLIVTRNKGDFAHSPVPAVTPAEFLAVYCPNGVEYELVDF